MEKKSIRTAEEFKEERFTKIDLFKNMNSSMFVLNFLPGQEMREHNHPGRELYLRVIQGNGEFIIDGNTIEVTEDDVIHIEPEEMLGFVNISKDRVSIYATMSKIHQ